MRLKQLTTLFLASFHASADGAERGNTEKPAEKREAHATKNSAPLPVTFEKKAGTATRGAGVALYRTRPNLGAGDKLAFLGKYDPKSKRIRLLDPPWIHVTWPRQLHWRIYFQRDSKKGYSEAVSRYLEPEEATNLEKKPAIREYIRKVKAGGRPSTPKLTLHDVYDGKVPKGFAKLDARTTMVGVYCDNLGRPGLNVQQCFFTTPEKAVAGGVALFTGSIHPNRPELSYRQKQDSGIHHFNIRLQKAEPIRVRLTEATARRQFVSEVLKARTAIEEILKREKLDFEFDPAVATRITWVAKNMVVSGVVTPRPKFSMQPVPFATVSVFLDPATGTPKRITVFRRIHRDPSD